MGDGSLIGWTITGAYVATALLCAWALHVARIGARLSREQRTIERRRGDRTSAYRASVLFWAMLGTGMIILGTNKQLDLHQVVTRFGRTLASDQGWYRERQAVQAWVAGGLLVCGFGTLVLLLLLTRELLPRHVVAFGGAVLLGVFVALRTLSFHHLDAWLFRVVLGAETRAWLELAGIMAVAVCAYSNARWYGMPGIPGRSIQRGGRAADVT